VALIILCERLLVRTAIVIEHLMQRSEEANDFESNSLSGTQIGWRTAAAGGPEAL